MRRWWPFGRKNTATFGSERFAEMLRAIFAQGPSKSGALVSVETALQVSTAFACGALIAEGLAQVPLKLYRKERGKREVLPAEDHPLYVKLHRKPNDWMSSYELRETMGLHAAFTGQAFAFINRIGEGRRRRIAELLPLEPGRVTVKQDEDWTLRYEVRGLDGQMRVFPAESIWHWRVRSWNTYMGLAPVRLAREALGLAMAAEESQARLHEAGFQPGGLVTVPNVLDEKQYKDLRGWLEKNNAGASNAGRLMLLDRGASYTALANTAADSQSIETRRNQVEEICRTWRVLPIMVGHSDKTATYASAEQMFIAHLVYTMAPWYERVEQSANVQLLTDDELEQGYYFKHVTAGMLRGALKDTAEFLNKLVLNGTLTRNEARELLERNPLDGLDQPLTPANTTAGSEPAPDEEGTATP